MMTGEQLTSLCGKLYGLSALWTELRYFADHGGDNWVLSHNHPLDHPNWVRVGTLSPAQSERVRHVPPSFHTRFQEYVLSYNTIAQLEHKKTSPAAIVPLADAAIAAKLADPMLWQTVPVPVNGKSLDFQMHVDGEYLAAYTTYLPTWVYIQARNVPIAEIALVTIDDLTPYLDDLAQVKHEV